MGATQTTFCNEAAVPVSTGLSIVFTYYYTGTLLPLDCVSYTVGRVWFTAFSHLDNGYDPNNGIGQLFFLTNNTTAAGLDRPFDLIVPPMLVHISVTKEEADFILESGYGFVDDNIDSVSKAYYEAFNHAYTEVKGFYTGSNHKVRVTGGPERIVRKIVELYYWRLPVFIVPLKFPRFKLGID